MFIMFRAYGTRMSFNFYFYQHLIPTGSAYDTQSPLVATGQKSTTYKFFRPR
jgi:hypothetical protein